MNLSGLLILKLLLVPCLIMAVTLAGRKWGATVAGCLAGFPVVTGPILFFLAVEQGPGFAAKAAVSATLAVLGNIAFGIAYSWTSRRRGWLLSLAYGWVAYFCMVAVLGVTTLPAWQTAIVTVAGLLLAARLYPAQGAQPVRASAPKSDLVHRMLAALALVWTVTVFSERLGPNWSGLFSVFPVMGSVLGVFSHRNAGQRHAVDLLRGMVQGFYAFSLFCLLLSLALVSHPIGVSFCAALAAAICLQAMLMHRQSKKSRAVLGARPRADISRT